ncbi:hypothetical protein HMPREF3291_05380 [Bacillus sp. HMSC76G11]|nr:hypothetical protein HMPREF3291_05380 [Bacillus sp. HMSC76G11]
MLFSICSSLLVGSLIGSSYFYQKNGGSNDASKIARICNNSGLTVNENGVKRNMQLLRRTRHAWGNEYAFRIPLGLSFDDFEKSKKRIQDGLNNKSSVLDFNMKDLRSLKLDKTIVQQINNLLKNKKVLRKEVELSFDGVLKIKVYNEPLTTMLLYENVKKGKGWKVIVGESRNGYIYHDFEKKSHMIIAGTTDFGKSTWVNCAITTLIQNKPDDVEFTLIDLKGGLEFSQYDCLPQVQKLATNPEEALEALEVAVAKMESIVALLKAKGFKNVKDAGYPKRHFVIIDEAADIADDKACQSLLKDIARKGRAAGLRLIYTTQYPTVETVSSQIKRNCIGRLCFVLDTATASTVVLDSGGAEKLPLIQGRALYKDVKLIEVQTPYISDEQVKKAIQPHINIRSRKERVETGGESGIETAANRKYTLELEET